MNMAAPRRVAGLDLAPLSMDLGVLAATAGEQGQGRRLPEAPSGQSVSRALGPGAAIPVVVPGHIHGPSLLAGESDGRSPSGCDDAPSTGARAPHPNTVRGGAGTSPSARRRRFLPPPR